MQLSQSNYKTHTHPKERGQINKRLYFCLYFDIQGIGGQSLKTSKDSKGFPGNFNQVHLTVIKIISYSNTAEYSRFTVQ